MLVVFRGAVFHGHAAQRSRLFVRTKCEVRRDALDVGCLTRQWLYVKLGYPNIL